jgi:tRNA dimethylallyltransferase
VSRLFCIVGPTGVGKSALAVDVAIELGAEVISADAFQIYQGFDVLSGKPGPDLFSKVAHHLIGGVPAGEEMSAVRFRDLALPVIDDISRRGKVPLVVGGSGLYIKSLTEGLAELPSADRELRRQLNEVSAEDLNTRLRSLDPEAAARVDTRNRRRLIRAIEIATARRDGIGVPPMLPAALAGRVHNGVLVFRDRDQLYERINQRVEGMLKSGAIEELATARDLSSTAEQMIGVKDIRRYLSGEISLAECAAAMQQTTRRYAKRQLTWFRHQTTFESLNLSLLNHNEAVKWVVRQALAAAHGE